MEDYKVIYVNIYDPRHALFKDMRKDKAECQTVSCNNSSNCNLFSKGECAAVGFTGSRCPYGRYSKETGFTSKARGYIDWIEAKKDYYKGVPDKVGPAKKVMAKVGDYIFLPYSFMNMNEKVPFLAKGGVFSIGSAFMKFEDFTAENIKRIVNFRPQAMMGNTITDYQDVVIPKFIKHLSEVFPDKFLELGESVKDIAEVLHAIPNVGRDAELKTLKPNVGRFIDIHKGEWTWDGTYLTSFNSHAAFMLVSKFAEIRIKPLDNAVVKVTDEGQVTSETVFLS